MKETPLALSLQACAKEQYTLARDAAKTQIITYVQNIFKEIQEKYREKHSLPDDAYPTGFTFDKSLLSSVLPEHLLNALLQELGFTNLKPKYLINPQRLNYIWCQLPNPRKTVNPSPAQQLYLDHASAMEQIRKDNLDSDTKWVTSVCPDAIPFAQDILERLRHGDLSRIEVPETSGLITLVYLFTTPKSLSGLNWDKTEKLNLFLQNYLEDQGITKDQGFTNVSCELYDSQTTVSITAKV